MSPWLLHVGLFFSLLFLFEITRSLGRIEAGDRAPCALGIVCPGLSRGCRTRAGQSRRFPNCSQPGNLQRAAALLRLPFPPTPLFQGQPLSSSSGPGPAARLALEPPKGAPSRWNSARPAPARASQAADEWESWKPVGMRSGPSRI